MEKQKLKLIEFIINENDWGKINALDQLIFEKDIYGSLEELLTKEELEQFIQEMKED